MRVLLVVLWALAVIFAVIAFVGLSLPAQAQATCAPLPNLIQGLREKFSEHVVVRADAGDRTMIVTRSDKGSWSLIIVRGEAACMVMVGDKSEIDLGL